MNFRLSLWAQLLLWVLIPVTALRLVSGVYLLGINKTALEQAYDESLIDTLRGLATRIETQGAQVSYSLPSELREIFSHLGGNPFFFQVVRSTGELLYGESDFGPLVAHSSSTEITSGLYRGQQVRIASLRVPVKTRAGDDVVYIRAAEAVRGRRIFATEISERIVTQQLTMVVLVTIAVLLGVRTALKPLREVRLELAKRSLSDLSPLDAGRAPSEIVPLINTINQLLGQLRLDVERQKRFVSNAAHQLRTPLAGLKTSAELALRETDVSEMRGMVAQILEGANRAVHLVKQLLAISRAEPSGASDQLFVSVNIAALAQEVCKSYLNEAIRKGIDLGYEGPGSVVMWGEATCLREMIGNLVDNAIRYTPRDGVVTVAIQLNDGRVKISVEDTGCGISSEERERVFERFYRVLGTGQDGSGLGLAIVREVAHMHGGSVSIVDATCGSGTHVEVILPLGDKEAVAQKSVQAQVAS